MDPIRFDPSSIGRLTRPQGPQAQEEPGSGGVEFSKNLKSFLGDVNQMQVDADSSISELASGRASNIHEVVLSVAKADISFKLLVELRNKLVEAYQKTMNMQI